MIGVGVKNAQDGMVVAEMAAIAKSTECRHPLFLSGSAGGCLFLSLTSLIIEVGESRTVEDSGAGVALEDGGRWRRVMV